MGLSHGSSRSSHGRRERLVLGQAWWDASPTSLAGIRARTRVRQAKAYLRLVGGCLLGVVVASFLAGSSVAVGSLAVGRTHTGVAASTTPTGGVAVAPEPYLGEPGRAGPFSVVSSPDALTVHDRPDRDSSSRLLDPGAEASGQLVFLVRDQAADWLEVYLPVRPNGSTGWLRRDEVELSQHDYRIELSISGHTLALFEGAEVRMEVPIGVGAGNTPTPGGVYYIKELLRPPEPSGFYGPYAYGLSGFSNVLDDYAGGTGVIGLHGTDDPSSVGRDASNGCIRLDNEVITRMVEEVGLPLGTPVIIMA